MQIDEQKILDHYLARRKSLLQELDSINAVIESIEWDLMIFGKDHNNNVSDKHEFVTNIGSTQGAIHQTTGITDDKKELSQFQKKQLRRYSKYNNSFTYNDKVYFVLTKMKSATVHEMVVVIKMYDENLDEKKLYNGLTMAASALNVAQEIASTKEGKRNRYFLKNNEEPETTVFKLLKDEGPF